MSENILELLKSLLTGPILRSIAEAVGLSEDKVKAGLESVFPTVLAGMLQKASQPGGGESLLKLVKDVSSHSELLKNPGDVLGSSEGLRNVEKTGGSLLNIIFGDRLGNILQALGNNLGLAKGVVNSLMALAGPLVVSQIGKALASKGLNAAGLIELLMGQKKFIQSSAPPGLANILGLSSLADLGSDAQQRAADLASKAERTGQIAADEAAPWLRWALPLGLLAALVLLGLYFLRPGEPQQQVAQVPPPPPAVEGQKPGEPISVAAENAKEKIVETARATEAAAENAKEKIAETAAGAKEKIGEAVTGAKEKLANASRATEAAVEAVKQKLTAFTLPGGLKLELPENSGLDHLASYLQNPKPDVSPAFPLPIFGYEPGTTQVSAASQTAMDLLAKILKAYPPVTIKLVGHPVTITDSVQQRAEALRRANDAKSLLVERGVDSNRIAVEAAETVKKVAPLELVVTRVAGG
jgi:outer membrane protein OmpA-like peptidoglycan-associated protein